MSPSSKSDTTQLATFEVVATVVDHPTDRRRWNGGPMESEDAYRVLPEVVEAVRAVLKQHGFALVRTSYGVSADEVDG